MRVAGCNTLHPPIRFRPTAARLACRDCERGRTVRPACHVHPPFALKAKLALIATVCFCALNNELQDLANALFEQRPESLTVNAAVCSDFKTVHWKGGGKTGGIVEFMSEVSCCNKYCNYQVVEDAMCLLCTLQSSKAGGNEESMPFQGSAAAHPRFTPPFQPARSCRREPCRSSSSSITPIWGTFRSCRRWRACRFR